MPRQTSDHQYVTMWPEQAANILLQSYADVAGEEALFRALLAERDRNGQKARFWIAVYGRLRSEM